MPTIHGEAGADQSPAGHPASSAAFERRTPEASLAAAFVHFLHTGVLPWWFQLPAGQSLENLLCDMVQSAPPGERARTAVVRALGDALRAPLALSRLVRQLSPELLAILLSSLSPEMAAAAAEASAGLAARAKGGGSDLAAAGLGSGKRRSRPRSPGTP